MVLYAAYLAHNFGSPMVYFSNFKAGWQGGVDADRDWFALATFARVWDQFKYFGRAFAEFPQNIAVLARPLTWNMPATLGVLFLSLAGMTRVSRDFRPLLLLAPLAARRVARFNAPVQLVEANPMMVRAMRLGGFMCMLVGAALVAPLTGCGGGQLGSELSVRPEPQSLGGGVGSTLHLPADRQYSIALAPTEESPELDGTAEADAQASKDGSASAVARVVTAGKATAGFQVGHAVKNDSDRQTALQVRVRCEHENAVESDPPSATPDAKTSLVLYARDQYNRLLRTIELAEDDSNDGAATSKDKTDVMFELLLGPGDTVNIFLAGSVQIDTRRGRTARGEVKLSGLQMDIETMAAPPVQKIADEQG